MSEKIHKVIVDPAFLPGNASAIDKTRCYKVMQGAGFSPENAILIGLHLDLEITMEPIYSLDDKETPACWWFDRIDYAT